MDYSRESNLRSLANQADPENRLSIQQPYAHGTQEELGLDIAKAKQEVFDKFPGEDLPIPNLPERTINDTAFYAAALSEGQDPVGTYQQIKNDLSVKGSSPLVEALNTKLLQEQDTLAKKAILSIFADKGVDPIAKQEVLKQYISSGFIEKSWYDRYITATASKDNSTNLAELEGQNAIVMTLQKRALKNAQLQGEINNYYSKLDPEKAKGFLGVILEVMPGLHGYNIAQLYDELLMGGEATTWEKIKAATWKQGTTLDEIAAFYTSLPLEKKQAFVRKMVDLGKDLPGFDFNKYQELEHIINGQDNVFWEGFGNVVGVLDAVGLGWMARDAGKKVKGLVAKVNPKSPAGATLTANPKQAGVLGATAIADESGEMVKAFGTTQDSLVQDWWLPKIDEAGVEAVPNLAKAVEDMDRVTKEAFEQSVLNPALFKLSETQATTNEVHQFIKASKYPIFNPGASTLKPSDIINEISGTKEIRGFATFSRTPDYGWTTADEAKAALDGMANDLPKNIKSNLSVVELAPNQHFIRYEWTREFDPTDVHLFGEDALKTSFLGFDVSTLSKHTGTWIWAPYDRVKRWVYKGATQSEFQERYLDQAFMKPVLEELGKNRFGKEVGSLLVDGSKQGKVFSWDEVVGMFPKKSIADTQEIYRGYVFGRRMADYNFNFKNRLYRTKLADQGYQVIYDADGSVARYAKVVPEDKASSLDAIFDLDTGKQLKGNAVKGRIVLQLERPVQSDLGTFTHALMKTDQTIGELPYRVLPRIDGYFPRQYKQFYWVDSVAKQLVVDGKTVSSAREKSLYKKAEFSAKTEKEAMAKMKELQEKYPHLDYSIRPDRMDSDDAIIESYQSYANAYFKAKSRGEHIVTVGDELAEIEDPLVALVRDSRSLAKRVAWSDWKNTFTRNFEKEYGEFLIGGRFPSSLADLIPLPRASLASEKKFREAVENYKYYAEMSDMAELQSDRFYRGVLSSVADILDSKDIFSAEVRSSLREHARGGNWPVRAALKASSYLFLFTNFLAQVILQSQQMFELVALRPKMFRALTGGQAALLMNLATPKLTGPVKDIWNGMTYSIAKAGGFSKEEFTQLAKDLHESGLVQSIDAHALLHGMLNKADRSLTTGSKFGETVNTVKGIASIPKLGFDLGVYFGDTAAWFWARQRSIDNGLDLTKAEVKANIATEAREIAASMTKTGRMSMQQGAWGIPFQFAANAHKLFLQPFSSKLLTAKEKGRLAAARVALYGAAGTGIVALPYGYNDIKEAHYNELPKEVWDTLDGGIIDWGWNKVLDGFFGEGLELDAAKRLAPVSEYGLPYFEMAYNIWKNPENVMTRMPLSSVASRWQQAYADIAYINSNESYDTEQKALLAIDAMANMSSGYSNTIQGLNWIQAQKIVDKFGNPTGMEYSLKVAMAKMIGMNTTQENLEWKMATSLRDKKAALEKDAKLLHNSLEKYMNQAGTYTDAIEYIRTSSYLYKNLEEEDRQIFLEALEREDKQAFQQRGVSVVRTLDTLIRNEMTNDKYNIINQLTQLSDAGNVFAAGLLEQLKTEGVLE